MIKYITAINEDSIELDLMNRKKTFKKNEEVSENIFTKTYPQYFKRIGETKGYSNFLATPEFISDPITEFLIKEKQRKTKQIEVEIGDINESK